MVHCATIEIGAMMKSESQVSLIFRQSNMTKYMVIVIPLRFLHTKNKIPEHLVDDMGVGIKNCGIAKAMHEETTIY